MVSKILSVAALAGIAAASCPLSVEISGATGHVVHVAVTNTGKEPITVFKGNTVLSEHATKDLLISHSNDKALQFEGVAVNYKKTGLNSTMFQTFQPGETFTSSVNAAKSYSLAGISEAKVTALQRFKYVTGTTGPSTLKEFTACQAQTSNSFTIVPDQSKAAADKITAFKRSSRISKRYDGCSDEQNAEIDTSIGNAHSMAGAARDNAGGTNFFYDVWFHNDDLLDQVKGIYDSVSGTAPGVSCAMASSGCDSGVIAYTLVPGGPVVPCQGYFDFPELADDCAAGDADRAGTFLHEMSHLYGTADNAYGQEDCKALSPEDAANNADTFEIYASSVRLGGCEN